MKDLTTTHRHYPQPHVNNRLQDDVGRLATAFEMVDQDINALQQDQVSNRWQTLDLTQADLQADTFYPVLLGLAPAMGSQVLELRRLQPEAAQEHPTTNWQAGLACLGDVWIGEHNLTLIRYAAAPEQDLLADYHWDQGTGCAVVWLRGQQVYQVRSSHQRLAVIEPATNQATLDAMTINDVQLQPQGVVLSTEEGSHTYAPRTAIDTDKVKTGQWNLLTFLDMQAALTTHTQQLEQLAQAKAQLADAQAQKHTALREQLQQQHHLLHQQTQLLSRMQHHVQPQIGDVMHEAFAHAYLSCDGQSYPRARYPALAEHLGEATWHEDDQGVASFRLPIQYDEAALQRPTKILENMLLHGPFAVSPERIFMQVLFNHSRFHVVSYDHAGQHQQILMDQSVGDLCVAGDSLYVASYTNGVQELDAATGKVKQSISISDSNRICVQGDVLWVATEDNQVITYNLTSHQTRHVVQSTSRIYDLAVIDDRLYLRLEQDRRESLMEIYNANTGALIEKWNPGLYYTNSFAVQGEMMAFAVSSYGFVRLYNRLTKAPMGDIKVPGLITPIDCQFDTNGLWIAWNSKNITYHDLSTCCASMLALKLDAA